MARAGEIGAKGKANFGRDLFSIQLEVSKLLLLAAIPLIPDCRQD